MVPTVKFKATLVAFAAAWGWDCLLILTALRWGRITSRNILEGVTKGTLLSPELLLGVFGRLLELLTIETM